MQQQTLVSDVLFFRTMITPLVIPIIFWVGAVICIFAGFFMLGEGGAQSWSGLLTIVLGPLLVRILCEILLVFFRIHETLTQIRHNPAAKLDQISV